MVYRAVNDSPEEIMHQWESARGRVYMISRDTWGYGHGCHRPLSPFMEQMRQQHFRERRGDFTDKYYDLGKRKRSPEKRKLLEQIEAYLEEHRSSTPQPSVLALAALGYHLSLR